MTETQETSMIRKVALAVVRGGKLLLVRKRGLDLLILPGGKPDLGETDEQALQRELREELGCGLPSTLTYLGRFTNRAAGEADKKVEIILYQGDPGDPLVPRSEIEALVWVSLSDPLDKDVAPSLADHILPLLRNQSAAEDLSEAERVQRIERAARFSLAYGSRFRQPREVTPEDAQRIMDAYTEASPLLAKLADDWPFCRQRYAGDGEGGVARTEPQPSGSEILVMSTPRGIPLTQLPRPSVSPDYVGLHSTGQGTQSEADAALAEMGVPDREAMGRAGERAAREILGITDHQPRLQNSVRQRIELIHRERRDRGVLLRVLFCGYATAVVVTILFGIPLVWTLPPVAAALAATWFYQFMQD